MATVIFMPKAGMAMEKGTILRWFKEEGDWVEAGEPLFEIETDKVNMEIEAPVSGVLLKIIHFAGEIVPVVQTIGWIGDPDENIEDLLNAVVTPSGEMAAGASGQSAGFTAAGTILSMSGGNKRPATPRAKRLAAEKGIDLAIIKPSGPLGEIRARDVDAIIPTPLAPFPQAHMTMTGPDSDAGESPTRKKLEGMRKIIAERMVKSHLDAPAVTLCTKAEVTSLLQIQKELSKSENDRVSVNDLLLKATAMALKDFPRMNTSLEGDEIVFHPRINLGMAVALEDGLIVPVIRDADRLSLKEISETAGELADRARRGRLKPDECRGGTFTLSNLGPYDIYSFTPILNPPESGILGACAIEQNLKLNGGQIEVQNIMNLCLTFDHRVHDGAQGAIFLKKIKTYLENPSDFLTV